MTQLGVEVQEEDVPVEGGVRGRLLVGLRRLTAHLVQQLLELVGQVPGRALRQPDRAVGVEDGTRLYLLSLHAPVKDRHVPGAHDLREGLDRLRVVTLEDDPPLRGEVPAVAGRGPLRRLGVEDKTRLPQTTHVVAHGVRGDVKALGEVGGAQGPALVPHLGQDPQAQRMGQGPQGRGVVDVRHTFRIGPRNAHHLLSTTCCAMGVAHLFLLI